LERSGRQHGSIQTLWCQDNVDSTIQAVVIAIVDITAQGAESSLLICEHTYRVQKATVTIQNSVSQVQAEGPPRSVLGISPSNFNQGLQASLSLAWITSGPVILTSNLGLDFDPFTSLLFVTDPTPNFSDLMDPGILRKTSSKLYTSLAAQFANRYLTLDGNTSFIETSEFTRPRLVVNALSVRLIEALLAVILIYRCFFRSLHLKVLYQPILNISLPPWLYPILVSYFSILYDEKNLGMKCRMF